MAKKNKILIIEDEAPIRKFLKAGLPDHLELIEAENGVEGLRVIATENPDAVLLDLGLPDVDGLEIIARIREWSKVPIIILSARGQESDKINALDSGADDYLTKPFGIGELLARIRVVLRPWRKADLEPNETVFEHDDLKINYAERRVLVKNSEVHLTPFEYKLLILLVQNADKVLTHKQLLSEVWGAAYTRNTHYLRVFMKQLRHKIEEKPSQPRMLITEPGIGYRFRTIA